MLLDLRFIMRCNGTDRFSETVLSVKGSSVLALLLSMLASGCSTETLRSHKGHYSVAKTKSSDSDAANLLPYWRREMSLAREACKLKQYDHIHFENAVRIAREMKVANDLRLYKSLRNLGEIYLCEKRPADAIACFKEACTISGKVRKTGDLEHLDCLRALARAFAAQKNYTISLNKHMEALSAIATQLQAGPMGIMASPSLSYIYHRELTQNVYDVMADFDRYSEIEKSNFVALLARLRNDMIAQGQYTENDIFLEKMIADIYKTEGHDAEAIRLLFDVISRQSQDALLMADARLSLGELLARSGRRQEAIKMLLLALSTYERSNLRKDDLRQYHILDLLCALSLETGDRVKGQEYNDRAWKFLWRSEDKPGIEIHRFMTLQKRAEILRLAGRHSEAAEAMRRARTFELDSK